MSFGLDEMEPLAGQRIAPISIQWTYFRWYLKNIFLIERFQNLKPKNKGTSIFYYYYFNAFTRKPTTNIIYCIKYNGGYVEHV